MNTRSLPPRADRLPTSLRTAVVTVLTALLVAGLLVGAGSSAGATDTAPLSGRAAAVKPSQDYPHMPARCATRREKIPSEPVVCPLNDFRKTRPSLVIWGDSHSWMFIPALRQAVAGRRVNLIAVMMGSCPPMDNQARPDDAVPACFRSNALGIDLTRALERGTQPYRVLLSGSWQRYLHALKVGDRASYVGQMALAMRRGTPRLVRTLRSIGAGVEVVGQVATVPARRPRCAQGNEPFACNLLRRRSLPEAAATRTWLRDTFRPVLGSRTPVDVNRTFCNARICRGKVGRIRTWFDDLHLSATRSATLAPYFADTVDAISPVRAPEPQPEPDGEEPCTVLGLPVC